MDAIGLHGFRTAQSSSTLPPMELQAIDDEALMLRYRDGDTQAFELLYARHKGALYRYLQRLCRSRERADDIFQEVWSKVIASREQYEVRAQFKTFLFRIAHHCAIDDWRRARTRREQFVTDIDVLADRIADVDAGLPEARLSESQLQDEFKQALMRLPAEQRDVFLLYEEAGLGLDEIGRITGANMETAKSRLRYAVNKLRAALKHHQTPPLASGVKS